MPSKRDVLDHLTRDELLAVVDRWKLAVPDRRAKAGLVGAVARSTKATLMNVLAGLARDRLKELCRAFDLDDAGREKAALIDRLAGSYTPTNMVVQEAQGSAYNSTGKALATGATAPGEKLTREKLEAYLWSAADILRGSIDSSDYKNYILGMLFLKRLSDRFEEECEALSDVRGADPEDADEHDFFVPKRARWPEIRKVATNIGETLNKAFSALEDENASLQGVLAGIDFNDERKLGDTRNRDNVLARLVVHFSKVDLRNANLSEPDMLGRAYEYLIERFADDAGKKGGEFYTPKKVVELIVEILAPKEGMRICDPTAGSAGMLIECAHHVERNGGNPKNLALFGQEKNLGTWALSKMNLLLHNLPGARIEKGDTIRDPRLLEGGELMLFDRVVANPPFSQKDWGHEIALSDPYRRFRFGVPPKKKQGSDLAFLSHMIASLNREGRLAVILPHGALFRGGVETAMRLALMAEDLLEAVIGLPAGLFYGTPIPAAILVLNRSKPSPRQRRILFVDASHGFEKGPNQDRLRDQDVSAAVNAFKTFSDVAGYARVVTEAEVADAGHDWRIENFVGPTAQAATVTGLGAAELPALLEERDASEVAFRDTLRLFSTSHESGGNEVELATDLGKVRSTWKVWSLDHIVEQVRNPVAVEPAKEYREIGVRSHGRGVFHKEPVSGEALGLKKVFWVEPGCLVFNVVFAWEGAIAVTLDGERGMIASHRFPMFRPNPEFAELEFLRILFQSRPGIRALGRISPGGAGRNKTLNQSALRALRIGLPSLPAQRSIVRAIAGLERFSSASERLVERLRTTRKTALELLGLGRILIQEHP